MKKVFLMIFFFILLLGFLEYKGIIWHTSLFTLKYEVEGLDISHYQGDINWEKVSEEDKFSFVYIKATEGHDFVDETFEKNWKKAKEQNFKVGAYHFFSMRSSGEEQAKHFVSVVPLENDTLPQVIDIEIPIIHNADLVEKEILSLSKILESYYGKKPILYVTYETYNAYIKNKFLDYNLWFRDIVKRPNIADREWLFWQYSNRGRVKGIKGYVDKNIFYGNIEEFNNFIN